jgi:hypothetical protein
MARSARAVAGLLVIAACGTPRQPRLGLTFPHSSSFAGRCWALRSVGWKDPFLPPGLHVRFDTAMAGERVSPWRLLHIESADSAFTSHLRIARWAPYEGRDSIFAVLGDGFTGIEMRLAVRVDSLRGQAHRFADAPHIRSGGAVGAASVEC